MGVPQAWVMSPSVKASMKKLQRQGFYGRDIRSPGRFQDHPLNLDRENIGSDFGHSLTLDWGRGNSGADCGNIHWNLI